MKTNQTKPTRTSMLDVGSWMFDVLPSPASILVFLLLLLLPAAVRAEDYTYTTNGGTITITGYTGPGGAVTIPSTINGLPVTRIGDYAFRDNSSLTSVTIPNSVTSIAYGAFQSCAGLTRITIPNSVTNLGDWVLAGCTSLTNLTIGNSLTSLRSFAFYSCTKLTSVTIGNGVNNIGDWAFDSCTSLTSLTIPNTVTSIGQSAFNSCTSLTNVTIGNSVTNIGFMAFAECHSLATVTIPKSVTIIGYAAFGSCTSLRAITVDTNNPAYSSMDGILFDKSTNTLIQCPGGKAGSYTIPNNVTNIVRDAFAFCTSLTNVTIGTSVSSISELPFYGCTSLSMITVEALNVFYSSVGGVLFDQSQTTLIRYPEGKAGSYTIPNSVTSIGGAAFWGCTSLTEVYFGGNAPFTPGFYYVFENNVTVYYLPGTTGWGLTYEGRPTALWLLPYPLILNNGPSFGVQTTGFGFIISWATNISVVVDACTDLANPIWSSVGTNTLTGGWSYFSDPQWTNYPSRFYRLRSP